MIGNRIGPYEITAKLGEGGMGEVYQAKDFHLGRNVAVKVLPEDFASDPERLARFEREAKLLAQLNHPNIAQIYGFEASGETRALVMELVEGPTLAERLELGSLSFNESLSISLQIAHALEEAHEKGIVHRDLKPQNIKASIEGKVKVLDFGLAKAMDPAGGQTPSSSALAQSPTLTLGATQMGMILGTAAYMSPEQAKGIAVDKRADIWAFGVVLHEMLVGGRLFDAPTVPETLALVLTRTPDLATLPDSVPPAIRSLLRRCLERNPKNRLHDIADARLVLEEVLSGKSDEPLSAVAYAAAAPVPASRSRKLALGAGAAVLVALGAALGALWPRATPEENATQYFPLTLPSGYRFADLDTVEIAISADGRRRAAAAVDEEGARRLLVASDGDVDWRVLEGTHDARAPFFSPDGRWVGFFNGRNVMRIAVDGGPPLPVAASGNQVRGGVWLPDRTIVFSPDAAAALLRVPESGGQPAPLTTLDSGRNERTHRWPGMTPDGRAVVFTVDSADSTEFYDDATIEAVIVATGERKTLVRGASMARFAAPDVLLFASAGSLFAQRIDPGTLEPAGAPVPARHVVATTVASGAVQFAASTSGTLLWVPGGADTIGGMPVWIDSRGARSPVSSERSSYTQITLSPDGRRFAAVESRGPVSALWIVDLQAGTRTKLGAGQDLTDPTWSADGERVAYLHSSGADSADIFWLRVDGRGGEEALIATAEQEYLGAFTPDGKSLVFERVRVGESSNDLAILRLDDRSVTAYTSTPEVEFNPELSPDGRWLAYGASDGVRPEIFVRPFPAGDGRWQISDAGGVEPHWSRDGKALLFRHTGTLHAVDVDTTNGFKVGPLRRITAGLRSGDNARSYSPAPDGERILALPSWDLERDEGQLDLALHWDRELRRLLGP